MLSVIFGGAFDPPHSQHVGLCAAAVKALGAERLVIVPTFAPPHKSAGFLDFDTRAELARTAFAGIAPAVEVDNIEKERGKDNYASIILPLLKKKYGEIVYLIGGDSLEFFDTWRDPAAILKTCPVAAAGRKGYRDAERLSKELRARFGGRFILLDFVGEDVSSAVVKAKLLLGLNPGCIPDGVERMLKERGCFREYDRTVALLKSFQSPELFRHSVAVTLRAAELNSRHNLKQDFKKVFLAALLHDNAKERGSTDGLPVPRDAVGTAVLHQFLGAEKAKRDFGVEDPEVLDAIRYHTTAKGDMTTLEKLIYTADSTSADRDYPPVPELAAKADEDFETGFRAVLAYTYKKVAAAGKGMYPLTEEAARYYLIDSADAEKEI